jgi:hypothetical protein
MATATKKAPARRAEKGTLDYLELALEIRKRSHPGD